MVVPLLSAIGVAEPLVLGGTLLHTWIGALKRDELPALVTTGCVRAGAH